MAPMTDANWANHGEAITRIANSVARRLNMTPETKQEFVESVNFKVFLVWDHFDPEKGVFDGWCATVLTNHGVSLIRKYANDRAAKTFLRLTTSVEQPPSDELDRHDEASRAVDQLESYVGGLDRIIVAIDCTLLGRLPDDRVKSWLTAATLSSDFQWRGLEAIDRKSERRAALAKALQQSEGWLRQRINRALRKLRECIAKE